MGKFSERWQNAGVFAKVTAALCVLAMLGILFAFGNGSVSAGHRLAQEYLAQQEQALREAEADVEQRQQELADAEAAVDQKKQAYDEAGQKVVDAEAALDKECSRSSYSYFYCDSICRPLHSEVSYAISTRSTCYDEWQDAKDEVSAAQDRLDSAREAVTAREEDVAEAERRYDEVLPGYIFTLIATLCFVLSLGALAMWMFLRDKVVLGKVTAGGLALGAVILFFCNTLTVVADLLLLGVAFILYRLARVDEDSINEPVWRNVAVTLAVLAFAVVPVVGGLASAVVALLYAAALICALFVLVPLEFTEYISIAKHLFLSVITCGIWVLVWVYHVTANLNAVEAAEKRRPANEVLLCMFLPLYAAYWLYKTAEGVELYAAENEKQCKLEGVVLIFAFLSPLFATVLLQSKINWIVGRDSE